MKRIAVIGSPGAGKSWISRRIGRALGLPVHHLDLLFWQPGWVQVDAETFTARQRTVAEQDEWVLDGNYTGTMDLRLARADFVVHMDQPTWRCLWGISRRWWTRDERSDIPKGCVDRLDWEFFHYTLMFRTTRGPVIRDKLSRFKGDVRILRSRRDVEEFLNNLPNSL